jgi:hypothetical protein
MYDQQAVDTWVYGQLSADSTLIAMLPSGASSIYNQKPPAGVLPPYIIFNAVPSPDTKTNGNVRVISTWNVSAQMVIIDPDTGKPVADSAAALIDQDMFTGGVSQNGFWIICSRTKAINLAPDQRDRLYRYVGGNYKIDLRPMSQPS